jgi:hypothetical protein
VDLLVVYDPEILPPDDATQLRPRLQELCSAEGIDHLDSVLLTEHEERELNFASRESAVLLYEGR